MIVDLWCLLKGFHRRLTCRLPNHQIRRKKQNRQHAHHRGADIPGQAPRLGAGIHHPKSQLDLKVPSAHCGELVQSQRGLLFIGHSPFGHFRQHIHVFPRFLLAHVRRHSLVAPYLKQRVNHDPKPHGPPYHRRQNAKKELNQRVMPADMLFLVHQSHPDYLVGQIRRLGKVDDGLKHAGHQDAVHVGRHPHRTAYADLLRDLLYALVIHAPIQLEFAVGQSENQDVPSCDNHRNGNPNCHKTSGNSRIFPQINLYRAQKVPGTDHICL